MRARVLRDYQAQYPDTIEIRQGERVLMGTRDTEFPGWVWATSVNSGKSGWVPETFLRVQGEEGEALRDYSARELTVAEGAIVTVVEEFLGWSLVESDTGVRGWIPQSHLARSVTPADLPL